MFTNKEVKNKKSLQVNALNFECVLRESGKPSVDVLNPSQPPHPLNHGSNQLCPHRREEVTASELQ